MKISQFLSMLCESRKSSPNTRKGWSVAVRNFIRLVGDLEMDDIDKPTVNAWAEKLDGLDITPNTANVYMRQVRSVFNKATDILGMEKPNPFRTAMIPAEPTVKRAISALHVRRMLSLPLKGKRARARDVFMLSVMLRGIPPVDLWSIRPRNIRDGYLTYRRSKTGALIRFPLEADALALIESLGVTEWRSADVKKGSDAVNYHLKKIGSMIGLRFSLTLYCARHTWSSAAMAAGASRSDISQMLGHSSEKTTEIYLNGLDTPLLDARHRDTMRYLTGIG